MSDHSASRFSEDSPPESRPSDALIDAYFAGELPPSEAASIRAYLAATPQRRGVEAGFFAAIRGEDIGPRLDVEASRAQFGARLRMQMDHEGAHPTSSVLRRRSRWSPVSSAGRMAVFAVAAICTIGGAGAYLLTSKTSTSQQSQIYQTAPRHTATVRTADGVVITLAPTTTVRTWTGGAEVTGSALFTVPPSSHRTYVVRTTRATVRVLGTTFMVRQYPNDAQSLIVVDDGKVAVHPLASSRSDQHVSAHDSQAEILSAGMLARVSDSSVAVTSGIAVHDYLDLSQGMLKFNGVSLRDVVAELGRVYGTTIRVQDSVLAREEMILDVSVTIQPLTQVLDMVGQVVNARVAFDGHAYVLSPGYVKPSVPVRSRLPQPEKQYGK